MSNEIVLASNNVGKIAEFNDLLSPFNLQVIAQAELGVDEAQETGLSFVENAILKARHASHITGLPAIADDSGLEVAVLDGQPGIYSARFAGENATDQDNNLKLLQQLEDNTNREANFRCVMVYMQQSNDPSPIIAEGILNGEIISKPRGENGFGYDPIFWVPELNKTCAELSKDQKNKVSHRAKATQTLLDKLIANNIINT